MKSKVKNFIRSEKKMDELFTLLLVRGRKKLNRNFIKYNNEMNFNMKSIIDSEAISKRIENDNNILEEANYILQNYFRQINGELIYIPKIAWDYDYLSNKQANFDKGVELKKLHNLLDIKNVWELSKFHWGLVLAIAYKKSGEVSYLNKLIILIEDWIKSNKNNINWKSPMEVSIRLVNLIEIYNILQDDFCAKFKNLLLRSIFLHFNFVYNNLEKGLISNNHYLTNLIALGSGSIFLQSSESEYLSKKGKIIEKFIKKEITKDVFSQINEDGIFYEDSFNYHVFNTEMLMLLEEIFAVNNKNLDLDKSVMKNIKIPILDFYNETESFNFGDLDNSRLLLLHSSAYKNHLDYDILVRIIEKEISVENLSQKNKIYNQSGIAIIHNTDIKTMIKCSDVGMKGHGGHSHNDQLHVSLYYKNAPLFIDTGSGTYTGCYEKRDEYRSIKNHNTININGDETNVFTGIFSVGQKTNVSLDVKDGKVIASHDGYHQKYGVIIERHIINSDIFKMEDRIEGNLDFSNNVIVSKFHLHSELKAELISSQICKISFKNGEEINLIVEGGVIEIYPAKASDTYFGYTDIQVLNILIKSNRITYQLL